MSIQKNFVVKNGLEVNTDLLIANATTNSVGIANTLPQYTLHVNGGIGATNVYVSGIATFASKLDIGVGGTIFTIQNNKIGVGTILPGYPLHVVGVGTALYVDGNVRITGDLDVDDVVLDQANINSLIVGASTATTLNVTGLTTTQNLYVSGVSTHNNHVDINGNLNVSGVATIANLGNVKISSGIVTAFSGIVTYYGDGRYLNLSNNVSTGIGIGTTGGIVGYGITFLDLKGAGVSTTFYNSNVGIATIFFEGGGSGTIGIGSTFPTISVGSGDLFYHIDYGRTFVYYDEVALGIGSTAVWVDASPFNLGVADLDNLTVSNLSVTNSASIVALSATSINSGIVTSTILRVGDISASGIITSVLLRATNIAATGIITSVSLSADNIISTGIITASDFNSTSDKSLKTNINTVDNALDIVNNLRGVSFDWIENGRSSYGVVAQELEQVLPALVSDTEIKTVNYNGIIGILIEAVKELSEEVERLKNK